jgi:hypothetical protein
MTPIQNNIQKLQSEAKYKSARMSLLAIVIFSVVNIFSITFADSYFLFSSYITQILSAVGAMFYFEIGNALLVVLFIILALLSVVPYFLFWLLSKNHPGCMIGALVLFSVDSVVFLVDFVVLLLEGDLSFIIDLVFRVWALGSLIMAVKYGFEAKKHADSIPAVSPTDFYTNDTTFEQNENAMITRSITLIRPKRFAGMAAQFLCSADGQSVGKLANGKTLTFTLDGNAHELIVQLPNGLAMCGVSVPAGSEHRAYEIRMKMGMYTTTLTAVETAVPPVSQ